MKPPRNGPITDASANTAEYTAEIRALLHGVQVCADRLGDGEDATRPQTLHGAEQHELGHRLGHTAEGRPEEKDDHPGEEDLLPTEHVGETTPQRDRRDLGEQEPGEHPRVGVDAVQVADDRRHRR